MKPELNNQQSDWLDLFEELNDVEAAQISGGAAFDSQISSFNSQIRSFDSQINKATAANIALMELAINKGTEFKPLKSSKFTSM